MTDSAPDTASQHSDNADSTAVDVWATLEKEIGNSSLWLANAECFKERDIVVESLPSSGWGPSTGKVLYEKVLVDDGNGRKRLAKRLFVAFLAGQVGTAGDGTRLGAAGDKWGKTVSRIIYPSLLFPARIQPCLKVSPSIMADTFEDREQDEGEDGHRSQRIRRR